MIVDSALPVPVTSGSEVDGQGRTVGGGGTLARRTSRRRCVQGILSVAGLGLLTGCGIFVPFGRRPAKMPVVGFLSIGTYEARAPLIEGFRQGLRDLGYDEGHTIAIEYRFAESVDQLADRAAELVGLKVDVILASGTPASVAAKHATSTIPIVMGSGGDPVATGLVASLARPGGNITGMSLIVPQVSGKRLELLKAVLPGLGRVGVLLNATNPLHPVEYQEIAEAARVLGVETRVLWVRTAADFEAAFRAAVTARADAIWGADDPIVANERDQVAALALRSSLPSLFDNPLVARAGGLLALGPDLAILYRRAAAHVDKILKGTRPADIPVEQPTALSTVVNLTTAQTLGLTIPQLVLQQATEIIQ